jgi:hypothetical protein
MLGMLRLLISLPVMSIVLKLLKNFDDDSIWQGYILPDLYSEPYKQVNFFVNFTATDGLARLKGKYLTDDFIAKSNQ